MPAQLVALNDGPSILLDKPIMLLGRHPECDIQIDSRKISRRHCCIAQVSDYLVVRDLGSTNGIRINNIRVLEGRLDAGDELTIGTHRYQVTWEEEEAMPRPVPIASPAAAGKGFPPVGAAIPKPRTAASAPLDDDALESCDEPVPLQESDSRADPRPLPFYKAPTGALPGLKPPVASDEPILPESLDLVPSSDVFPGMGNGAPPS
jgi:predicted component of type VI protein secretion system